MLYRWQAVDNAKREGVSVVVAWWRLVGDMMRAGLHREQAAAMSLHVQMMREHAVKSTFGWRAADDATRASGIVVIVQVAGGGWDRRAGGGDVIAWAVDGATRAGGGNVIARAADNATREGGKQWHQARMREGGEWQWQMANDKVWGGGGE